MLSAQTDQAVQGRVGVAAARIGLHRDVQRFPVLAEPGDRALGMRRVGVADQQAMAALDGLGRAAEALGRQGRRDQAIHRRLADLPALVPGAVLQELQRAGRLAAGHAEGRNHLLGAQAQHPSGRGRGAEGPCSRRWVETAGVVGGGIQRQAQPAADLVSGHDGREHRGAVRSRLLASRQGRGDHRGRRMQGALRVGVVEIQRVAEDAVQQGGDRRGIASPVAHHRADPLAIQAQPPQRREHGGSRFRLAPRTHRAGQQVQRQGLGPLRRRRRDVGERQVGGERGQGESFIRHRAAPVFSIAHR